VADCIANSSRPLHFVGVGNHFRRDDAAGLVALASLKRSLIRPRPGWVKFHDETSSERALSKIPSGEGIVVFDAVESNGEPGRIVCASLADTKYGFFATHNVPLRLIPGLAERADSVFLIGVQPESIEVGEGLSATVSKSVDELVTEVARQVRRIA
jgi:hydrogenase maturation protease